LDWHISAPLENGGAARRIVTLEDRDPPGFVITASSFGGGMQRASLPQIPFSRGASIQIAADDIVHATGDYYEYRVYSREGGLLRAVRSAAPVLRPTGEDLERAKAWFIRSRDKEVHKRFVEAWQRLELPNSLPAFSRMLADEDGNVWLRNYEPETIRPDSVLERTGTTGEWWARFDRNGTLTGTLRIPDWHSVVTFSRGNVILRHIEQEDGFTWVSVHRVVNTEG
jgi:hypothetical protein